MRFEEELQADIKKYSDVLNKIDELIEQCASDFSIYMVRLTKKKIDGKDGVVITIIPEESTISSDCKVIEFACDNNVFWLQSHLFYSECPIEHLDFEEFENQEPSQRAEMDKNENHKGLG